MGEAGGDETLIDYHGGFLEPPVHVAIGPLGDRLAHGKLALLDGRKIAGGPLDRLHRDSPARHVAVAAGVGPARIQALKGIECIGQGFQVKLDQVDGVLGGGLVVSGHSENGFAHVAGLVGEDRSRRRTGCLRGRDVVGGQYGMYAFQGQSGGGIDTAYSRVGHGTGQELAKYHALGTKILGVLGLPGDLAAHIRRHEIVANQRVCHVIFPIV